jgi:hypothetical protein
MSALQDVELLKSQWPSVGSSTRVSYVGVLGSYLWGQRRNVSRDEHAHADTDACC